MKNEWGKIHAQTLARFLKRLNEENIAWLIIRNHEGLPNENNSKDVDIAISKLNWDKAHTILLSTFRQSGFQYYSINKYQFIHCYSLFNTTGISFKIDLFDCNEYKGLVTHSFRLLNENKVLHDNGIYAPHPLHRALILWLRPLLGAGFIKNKYVPEIITTYRDCKDVFKKELNRLFGKKVTNSRINCFDEGKIEETLKYRKQLILNILIRSIYKKPLQATVCILKHYFSTFIIRVNNLFIKPYTIAVIGPDGAGKSTFIDGLIKSIAFYYVADESKCHLYHFRPTVLPNLGALGEKMGVMKEDKNFTDPHRGKPTGKLYSFIRMAYYWLDYLVGVPLMLRKDAKFDRFTIYDRYIYDFLVDPRRSRINLPNWLLKTFAKLVFQPRIVFVLLADAETIYKRKQELAIDEINRQLGEYSKLVQSNKRFAVIDASKSPEVIINEAMQVVIEKFNHRIK